MILGTTLVFFQLFAFVHSQRFDFTSFSKIPSPEKIKTMIETENFDVNAVNKHGDTALHDLIQSYGSISGESDRRKHIGAAKEIINTLFEANFDGNIANNKGKTILDVSIYYEDTVKDLIPILLEKRQFKNANKAFYHSKIYRKLIIKQDSFDANKIINGELPLTVAAKCFDVELVRELLKKGADVNNTNDNSNTSFHEMIAAYGSISWETDRKKHSANVKAIIDALFEAKFNGNITNKIGNTILDLSIYYEDTVKDLIPILLEKQQFKNANKAFYHSKLYRKLIIEQDSFDANKIQNGELPLTVAAKLFDVELVRELLKKGADVNNTNDNSNTSFHEMIAAYGSISWETDRKKHSANVKAIIDALVEAKFNGNITNKIGNTILDLSIYYEDKVKDLIPFLLERMQFDNVGNAFYHSKFHKKFIVLKQKSFSANQKINGEWPLSIAAELLDLELVREILNRNDVNKNASESALMVVINKYRSLSDTLRHNNFVTARDIIKTIYNLADTYDDFVRNILDLKFENLALQLKSLPCNEAFLKSMELWRLYIFKKKQMEDSFRLVREALCDFDHLFTEYSTRRIELFKKSAIDAYKKNHDFHDLRIDRENLLATTLQHIALIDPKDLKRKKIYIYFKGEEGGDGGALTREFFEKLMDEMVKKMDIFTLEGEYDKFIHVKSTKKDEVTPEIEEQYEFAGMIFGLIILTESLHDVPFCRVLLRHLLGLSDSWRDLNELDKTVYERAAEYL